MTTEETAPRTAAAPAAAGVTYDVFLSHNSDDKPAVRILAERLRDVAGISPFLDAWHLVPGEPWQEALEEAIGSSRSCAVFIGPAGFGTWENEEMRAALSRRVRNPEFRVIPVILPGADLPRKGRLPPFLSRLTWVDFRPGLDDAAAFDRLVKGIRGLAPDQDAGDERLDTAMESPFRGLESFDVEHARYFFGREALTQQLVEELREDRFLAVVGASGSGKSSVVRAGLVPALAAGGLAASGSWKVAITKPGAHPMESLAGRLAAVLAPGGDLLASRASIIAALRENERGLHVVAQTHLGDGGIDGRILIVVDQFEEVFTLCHDDAERTAFVDSLLYASSVVGGQVMVVLTMRADFFGKCATLPVLAARLTERDVLVPPMTADELRSAMTLPAEAAGLYFEKGLVDTILDDLGDEPGSLPLLQHTLLELFEGRRERWLTIDRYRAIGGVRGAIASRAESIYERLTAEQQTAARRVLLRLTEPGEGTEDTRRRAPMGELLPKAADPEAVEAVVNQLADARLLVTSQSDSGDDIVDVAHEALIRGWPRLQDWIKANPAGLRIHRRITDTSAEWAAASREPSYLFTGQRLEDALRWSADNDQELNDQEREFLAESRGARDRAEQTRRRRTRLTIAGAAAAFAAVAVFAVVAAINWQSATRSERQANAQYALAFGQRIAIEDPLAGLFNAFNGLGFAKESLPDLSDFRVAIRDMLATGRAAYLGPNIEGVFPSPDGRFLVVDVESAPGLYVGSNDGEPIAMLDDEVFDVRFSKNRPSGVFAVTYESARAGEPGRGDIRRTADGLPVPLEGGPEVDVYMPGAEDAGVLAVIHREGDETASEQPGRLELRSTRDGSVIRPASEVLYETAVEKANGTFALGLATGGQELVRLIDGQSLGEFPFAVVDELDENFEEDQFRLELVGDRFVMYDFEGCELRAIGQADPIAELESCDGFTVSPDGSLVALMGRQGNGMVWRVDSGAPVCELPEGTATVAFSPARGAPFFAVEGAGDVTEGLPATLVRSDGCESLGVLAGPGATFSPDGALVAVISDPITVYRTADATELAFDIPVTAGSSPYEIAFGPGPDDPMLVRFNDDSTLVFAPATGDLIGSFPGSVLMWPDGGPLIDTGFMDEGDGDRPATLVDRATGSIIIELGRGRVFDTAFSTDAGATAAIVTYEDGETDPIPPPGIVTRDGRYHPLATGDFLAEDAVAFNGSADAVTVADFDDVTTVWGIGRESRLLADLGLGVSTAWIGDGQRLAAWDRNGPGYILDLELLRAMTPIAEEPIEEAIISAFCGLASRWDRPATVPVWMVEHCR